MYELIIYIAGILTTPGMIILWEGIALYKKNKKLNLEKNKTKKQSISNSQKKKQIKANHKKRGSHVRS